MPTEEIIVLATSGKVGGLCIAGVATGSGEWVRPVSEIGEGELYPFHYRVEGRSPSLFDVVEFSYERRLDDPAQPENLLIADEPWRLTGHLDPEEAYEELSPFLTSGPALFGNCDREVTLEEVAERGVESSLALIEPGGLRFVTRHPFRPGSRPSVRALFSLGGQPYDLPVTDSAVKARLVRAGFGEHAQDQAQLPRDRRTLMTVSLGGEKYGSHWKLAAAFLSVL